jgi:two-component system OmpR family sensor kinase
MTRAITKRRLAFSALLAPRSLRNQLLARSLMLLAGLLLLIGILQYVFMKDFVYENKAESLRAQLIALPMDWARNEDGTISSNRLFRNVGPGDGSAPNAGVRERPNMSFLFQPGLTLSFIAPDGTVTELNNEAQSSLPTLSEAEYKKLFETLKSRGSTEYKLIRDLEGEEQLVVYRLAGPPNRADGIFQAGTDTHSLNQLLLTQLAIFAALSIIAMGAGLGLYLPLLKRTLQPLSNVVSAAQRTDAGNLTERMPDRQGQVEIDQLSEAFNGMLGRLDQSFHAERKTTERMRRFIADASHELRTPLTSIHGFLEVLLRGAAANPEQLRKALTSMHSETTRINKLVEDLLAIAKLDQEPSLLRSPVRLDLLLKDMELQLQLLAGSRLVKLQLDEEITCSINSDQFKQVMLNFFLNAVQHTDEQHGEIVISLSRTSTIANLAVTDNGTGISPEHLPKLFERFYRSESSRTRRNGGSGLGLSISAAIVEAHGGTIQVRSDLGQGSAFLVTLPLA